ncbi:MAG: biopolymer transporter ExbD [Phycisphaerales bacterium]|jgi:biopolymer transport protein TolR|nr:biopolymer transporter ExbD [Phycisphaerales bacterium]
MRARPLHPHRPVTGEINVTPLIDVVMCLIIFFLIVGKLAMDPAVRLPTSATGQVPAGPEPLSVVITRGADAAPSLSSSEQPITLEGLETLVRAAQASTPPRPVLLRASADLPFETLSPVLEACRRAGLTSARLATERSP